MCAWTKVSIRKKSDAARLGLAFCQRLSRRQRLETPAQFRDLLLGIAMTSKRVLEAA